MISNNAPLQAISYLAMPKISAGGRAYIPVSQSQFLYSHFKYVQGFVDPARVSQGLGVDKLRILNSIIDQLVSMKTNEAQKAKTIELSSIQMEQENTEANLDSLIEYYHNEIKTALAQTENIGYGGQALPAGVLDLTA